LSYPHFTRNYRYFNHPTERPTRRLTLASQVILKIIFSPNGRLIPAPIAKHPVMQRGEGSQVPVPSAFLGGAGVERILFDNVPYFDLA
jgi:hypothetical protein